MNRLDQIIADRGLAVTRSKAADSIRRGKVLVNGVIARKISQKVSSDDVITIDDISLLYVSRSALKLLFLLEIIDINIG
ncbi:MAG: 23S rRNA (cytidine1920-2'-O)/16S rRNA (cytidine1409-2'-O)-methyltransferase, partial [Alphaproteobacteria bacterium]